MVPIEVPIHKSFSEPLNYNPSVSFSLIFTILAFAALSIALFQLSTSGMVPAVQAYILVAIQAADFLGNAVAVLLLGSC